MNKKKIALTGILFIILLLAIPATFAADNNNTTNISPTNDTNIPVVNDADLGINDTSEYVSDVNSVNTNSTDIQLDGSSHDLRDSNTRPIEVQNYTNNTTTVVINHNVGTNDSNSQAINQSIGTYFCIVNTSDLSKVYGAGQSFNGTIFQYPYNIVKDPVSLNILRLSDNSNKTYKIIQNNGNFSLPINLSPGTYLVKTTFNSSCNYNYIFISKYNNTKNQTSLLYNNSLFANGFKGQNFTGTLKSFSGEKLINKTVSIKITRKSTGASKVYNVTTDENGVYNLPINLAEHSTYTFKCSFTGDEKYDPVTLTYIKSFQ